MEKDTTHVASSGGSPAWARAFAVLYDPFLWAGERAGLRGHRKQLLSQARKTAPRPGQARKGSPVMAQTGSLVADHSRPASTGGQRVNG
jgi:hypothetical protein